MKYLLLICRDPAIQLSDDERAAMPGWVDAWVEEMERRGVLLQRGHELRPSVEAKTVRVRDLLQVFDGPFAETKEQIGGFDVVECVDLDEALEVASKHPVARSAQSISGRSGKGESESASRIGQRRGRPSVRTEDARLLDPRTTSRFVDVGKDPSRIRSQPREAWRPAATLQ